MIDPNVIFALIFGSVIVGGVTAVLPSGLGKLIAILGLFPFVFLSLTALFLGSNTTNISDSATLIAWYVENSIPLILAFVFEGVGASIVEGFKRRPSRK